jgi:hypothetical protein
MLGTSDAGARRGRPRPPRATSARTARQAAWWLLIVGALTLGLVPVIQAPVTSDDYPMLVQSFAAYAEGGVVGLAEQKAEDSLTSSHVLPVNGVLQFIAVLSASLAATQLGLPLDDAWGLTQVAWMLAGLGAATFFMASLRRLWLGLRATYALLGLVLVCTVQVHGHWSNDPVISYGAVAWGTAVATFLYLGCVLRWLAADGIAWRWSAAAATAGVLGVLTYELVLAAVAGAGVAVAAVAVDALRRRHVRDALRTAAGGAVMTGLPALTLLAALLMRSRFGTNDYTGTTLGGSDGFVSAWAVATASSFPATAWGLSASILGLRRPEPVALALFLACMVPLVLAIRALRRAPASGGGRTDGSTASSRALLFGYVAALAVAVLGSVAIIVSTEKHRFELGAVLGRVYVFYALGLLAVTVAMAHLAIWLWQRRPSVLPVAALAVLAFGAVQFQINYSLSKDLHSQWRSAPFINGIAAEADVEERCGAFIAFASRPLNGYDKDLIEQSVQRAYESRYGEPFCPEQALNPAGLAIHVAGDTSGPEVEGESQRYWWLTGSRARLTARNTTTQPVSTVMTLPVSNVPCGTPRTIVIHGAGGVQQIELGDLQQDAAEVDLTVAPMESVEVQIAVSGPGCTIPSDPRTFTAKIGYPSFSRA